jgi:hypothetical protein
VALLHRGIFKDILEMTRDSFPYSGVSLMRTTLNLQLSELASAKSESEQMLLEKRKGTVRRTYQLMCDSEADHTARKDRLGADATHSPIV